MKSTTARHQRLYYTIEFNGVNIMSKPNSIQRLNFLEAFRIHKNQKHILIMTSLFLSYQILQKIL